MDQQEFCSEIGNNIRIFRKLQHLTQQELADKLHKSLACISKYEKGRIVIDIYTLYEIADALKISPHMLLPQGIEPYAQLPIKTNKLPPLFPASPIYFYCLRTKRREIISSVIDIHEPTMQATLYFDFKNPENYKAESYLLLGNVVCSETNVRMYFSNPLLNSDFFLVGCHIEQLLLGHAIGFGAALDTNYKFCASKVYLSQSPVRTPEILLSALQMDKEDIRHLKKTNCLSL